MAGELFLVLLILKVTQCSVYVMGGDGFSTIVASFGDAVSRFGPWIFQVDGFVVVASPANACRLLQPAPNDSLPLYSNIYNSLNNTTTSLDFAFIALIKRGDCEDDLKVLNAQQAGFNGAIVYNSDNMTISPMHGHTWINEIEIPSVLVDRSAGERLKLYNWTRPEKFVITMVNFFNIPLKYVLLSLILLVAASFLVLTGCFSIHICNLWRRARRGRLSRRHLRRLLVKRYNKGQDPYETCPICLEDYEERQKVRLLLCRHAFHTECVDPWLLHNHRRCPVCNRIVDLSKSSLPPAGTRLRVFWARLSQRFLPTSWQERPVTTPTSDSAALVQNFRDDDDTVPLLQPNCEESSPLFRPVDVAVITSAHSETADATLIIPTNGITIKFSDGTKSWAPLPDDEAHVINSDFDDQLLSVVDPPSHLEAN